MTNPDYNLYFFDIKKGRPLKQLLSETGKVLSDDTHLFRFWAKELLYAFKDITYKSTYNVKGAISLRNVYISDLGIKTYLKKLKFGDLRDETLQFHLQVEAKMLRDYGKLLVEMLTNETEAILELNCDEILNSLAIEPELKAIIYECIHAIDKVMEMEQAKYDEEINEFILAEKLKK